MDGWRLVRGDTLVGELHPEGRDLPWSLYRFTPGPGWDGVRELFERLASPGPDPDGRRFAAAVRLIQQADLRLVAVDPGTPDLPVWRACYLRIDGDSARLRPNVSGGQ
ncbi:hypothetical protein [Kitasatospora sp. NPDC088134]|uniref:hypothetical protein n=1 Tax=Kitasatospora sp. NPDC088134 TaxID=3364071 RepID=UPI003800B168